MSKRKSRSKPKPADQCAMCGKNHDEYPQDLVRGTGNGHLWCRQETACYRRVMNRALNIDE